MTYVFIPNAHGPPHLGHFYHLLVLRMVYLARKLQASKPSLNLNIDFAWELWFDATADREFAPQYEQMMDWMEMPPDRIRDVSKHGTNFMRLARNVEIFNIRPGEFFGKLAMFDLCGVREIVRGCDKNMSNLRLIETDIAMATGLAYPRIIPHEILFNEDGNPISASNNDEDYALDFSMDFDQIVDWFMDGGRVSHTRTDFLAADPEAVSQIINDPLWDKAGRLILRGKMWMHTAMIKNTAPRNWKTLA